MHDVNDTIETVRRLDPIDGETLASDWSDSALSRTIMEDVMAGETSAPQSDLDIDRPTLWKRTSLRLGMAATVIATITIAVPIWPSGIPPALAGWTTEPQPVPDEMRQRLIDHCQSDPKHLPDQMKPQSKALLSDPGEPDLIDRRGGFAVARWHRLNGGKEIEFECTVGDNDGDGEWDFGGQVVGIGTPQVGPDSYERHVDESFGHRIRSYSGRAVDGAAQVVGIRADGTKVQASLSEEGYFILWWPEVGSDMELERIVTYGPDGQVLNDWNADFPSEES